MVFVVWKDSDSSVGGQPPVWESIGISSELMGSDNLIHHNEPGAEEILNVRAFVWSRV